MTTEERQQKLNKILELLQESNYIYDTAKGGMHGKTQMPPPLGTRMNCESAARVFMQLAKDMEIENLQALYFKEDERGYGYFVPANGKLALGCQPEINSPVVNGWEFDNHWRVKDITTGQIYDPTFGTSGENPIGILGTSMETGLNFNMKTIYGEKYCIERQGMRVECSELSKALLNQKYLVNDANFVLKQMTHLR